ncbi:fasciclin domain-containing protein [Taibaiella koreensis]|uniref:fasciclin domain-containing protein n=1 Tax=Taibaiella koreensis TaxID=1268548 RepID=UPI000E59BA36|nr:fasciclin domain-containing protein [Taibaiella koreensis]
MKRIFIWIFAALLCGTSVRAHAQSVLKEKMPPTIMKYLVDMSPEYATLVKAINAARLAETMEGPGPMTLFAPANRAFAILPAGTVDNWLKPEMMDSLQKVLSYHVVAGNWPLTDLQQKIKEAGGEFFMPTIGPPGKLSFVIESGKVMVKDQHGFKSMLATPVAEQNGLVYNVDKVLLR